MSLLKKTIKLAYTNPRLRAPLLQIIRKHAKADEKQDAGEVFNKLPKAFQQIAKMVTNPDGSINEDQLAIISSLMKGDIEVKDGVLVPKQGKKASETSTVPEWAKGKKFKNPETGRDNVFSSLPKDLQKKLREQHSKNDTQKSPADAALNKEKGSVTKALDKAKNFLKGPEAKIGMAAAGIALVGAVGTIGFFALNEKIEKGKKKDTKTVESVWAAINESLSKLESVEGHGGVSEIGKKVRSGINFDDFSKENLSDLNHMFVI